MGYTTEFKGEFRMTPAPSAELVLAIMDLAECEDRAEQPAGCPDSWCQWTVTKDRQGIKWNHSEKFYNYQEWLQWIIDNLLKPNGVTLTGSVEYQGEEVGDCGILSVEDGVVRRRKLSVVTDDLAELVAFRDFVLASRWGEQIAQAWKGRRK